MYARPSHSIATAVFRPLVSGGHSFLLRICIQRVRSIRRQTQVSHFATSRLPVQPTARPPSGQGRDQDAASHTTGQEGSPHLFSGFSLEPKRPGSLRAAPDRQPVLTLKEDRGVARASRVLGRTSGLTQASKSQAGSLGRVGRPLQRAPLSSAERAR